MFVVQFSVLGGARNQLSNRRNTVDIAVSILMIPKEHFLKWLNLVNVMSELCLDINNSRRRLLLMEVLQQESPASSINKIECVIAYFKTVLYALNSVGEITLNGGAWRGWSLIIIFCFACVIISLFCWEKTKLLYPLTNYCNCTTDHRRRSVRTKRLIPSISHRLLLWDRSCSWVHCYQSNLDVSCLFCRERRKMWSHHERTTQRQSVAGLALYWTRLQYSSLTNCYRRHGV